MRQEPRTSRTIVVIVAVVAAVIVSAVLAPLAWEHQSGPDGRVGVVTLEGPITSHSAETVIEDLRAARTNDSIDAIVLRVNSPGGAVGASESLYFAVKRTAAQKPVVANVAGAAASGGYMAILGADEVYTTPSSTIGSVGVYGTLPPAQLSEVENTVTSAPTKGTGGTEAEVRLRVERIKQRFVGLVMEERGSEVTLDRTAISRAKVYTGGRAVELGLADAVGGKGAAVQLAASRASLKNYEVVTISSDDQRPIGLFVDSDVDRTRYLALHGLPDSATVTPIEAVSSPRMNRTTDASVVAVGGDRR